MRWFLLNDALDCNFANYMRCFQCSKKGALSLKNKRDPILIMLTNISFLNTEHHNG